MKKPAAKDTPVIFVCGRRRSGKSAWTKRQLSPIKVKRLLVWDPTGEYGRDLSSIKTVTRRGELIALLEKHRHSNCRVAFQGSAKDFEWFCKLARLWGSCTVVVEELASVTKAGRAPTAWGDLIRMSAHDHNTVYGIAQRPAEVDKTIIGNASMIHYCPLARHDDVALMAKEMRMKQAELDTLKPCQYIEFDTATLQTTRGKLTFK